MGIGSIVEERLRQILEMRNQGLTFDHIATKLMPSNQRQIMRVASLFRSFDTKAFQFAISKSEEETSDQLRKLLANGSVQESCRSPGLLSVPQRIRVPQLESWGILKDSSLDKLTGSEAEEFISLHCKLADHFKGKPQWTFEYLHHLVVASPSDGIALMEQMVKECLPQPDETTNGASDAVHEEACAGIALARACDILDIVDQQKQFLPKAVNDRCQEFRRLAGAWSYWCDAWLKTRRYISRDEVHGWFTDLHRSESKRILEIYAPGGSGKTMSLRWLIAHHCVPRRKPIAHLDFDHFIGNPQRPWQLLLQCAERINLQLPGAPFDGLIQEGRDMQEALVSNTSAESESIRSFETNYPVRFGNVIKSSTNSIVTIIVDTFEEAMVRSLTPVPPFVAMLIRLASSCPQIRLIVCGRYSMEHRDFQDILKRDFPEEHGFYQLHLKRHAILQFDMRETGKYLRKRGLDLNDEYLARLFEASTEIVDANEDSQDRKVSPFHLGLIVDLIRDRKGDLERIDQLIKDIRLVKVIYLIERVLLRISDVGVRWLLRYGVVPRQLSKDFFQKVILPYLHRVNHGKADNDDPGDDPVPPDLAEESLYFKESAILEEGPDVIWKNLCNYASSDSWVEQLSPDVLSFHTCVREPMRALLREREVLRRIHRDAAEYFEKNAAAAVDSRDRISALREAIYHRIQFQGRAAAEYCGRLCRQHMDAEEYHTAFELAEEIVAPEYRPQGDTTLVDDETIRSAYTVQCLAAIDLADLAVGPQSERKGDELEDSIWLGQANHALGELERLELSEVRETVVSDVISNLIRCMIAVRLPHQSREQLCESVLQIESRLLQDHPMDLHERIVRSVGIGQAKLGNRQCREHFATLLNARLRSTEKMNRPMTGFLIKSLAQAEEIHGTEESELRALSAAILSISKAGPGNRLFFEATRVATALMETVMRPEAAAGLIEELPEVDANLELCRIRATVKDDPVTAKERLNSFRIEHQDQHAGLLMAESLVDSAWANAMLADVYGFQAALSDAFGSFRTTKGTYRAAQCRLMEAEICVHHQGNYARASSAIREWGRSAHAKSTHDDPEALRARLLTYEINEHTAELLSTTILADDLLAEAWRSTHVADQIRCAMTLFRNLKRDDLLERANRIAELLIQGFTCIQDGVARSRYAWLLRDTRRTVKLNSKLHKRLVKLIRTGSEKLFGRFPGKSDKAWASLANAHLLRFLGEDKAALDFTRSASIYFSQKRSLTGLREVWYLNAILGSKQPSPRELDQFADDEYRTLRRAIAVEQAEYCLIGRNVSTASKWLELIELQDLDTLPSCFGPRALFAMAVRDSRRGDQDSAARLLKTAEQAYSRLDDKLALSQISSRFSGEATLIENIRAASTPQDNESVWSAAPARLLKLSYPREKQRDAGVPFGVEHLTEIAGQRSPSEQSLLREKLMTDVDAAPYELVEAVANHPRTFAGRVIERLFRDELPHSDIVMASDLVIASENIALAGVPWELARWNKNLWRSYQFGLLYRAVSGGDRYRVRWLQEALRAASEPSLKVDERWGSRTADALSRFKMSSAISEIAEVKTRLRQLHADHARPEEPWAVILQSTFERQRTSQRGLQVSGSMLPKLYEECGFRCRTFEGLDLEAFNSEWTGKTQPVIIHIYAPYAESRSTGSVEPDFGNRSSSLRRMPSRAAALTVPSLLILDGPAEPDPIEQMRQIFLRNATGTLLAQRGMANIIALGLDAQPDFRTFEKLLSGIRSGCSLRELYASIADRGPGMSLEQLDTDAICGATGSVVPAIWTADPDLSVLLSTETLP